MFPKSTSTVTNRTLVAPEWRFNLGREMHISVKSVRFDDQMMWVSLSDGRMLGVPIRWFPRLLNATSMQREQWEVGPDGDGLHWDEIDEDISLAGLLAGRADRTKR